MKTATVNLRRLGTDPSNPEAGALVGQATVECAGEGQFDSDYPTLIRLPMNQKPGEPVVSDLDWKRGRLFRFVRGTFAYGGGVTAEYAEVVPQDAKFLPVAVEPPGFTHDAGPNDFGGSIE